MSQFPKAVEAVLRLGKRADNDPVLIRAAQTAADIISMLEARGRTTKVMGFGCLVVDRVDTGLVIREALANHSAWSQSPRTGKLSLSYNTTKLSSYGCTKSKARPEPKAGFPIAKIVDEIEEYVDFAKKRQAAKDAGKEWIGAVSAQVGGKIPSGLRLKPCPDQPGKVAIEYKDVMDFADAELVVKHIAAAETLRCSTGKLQPED